MNIAAPPLKSEGECVSTIPILKSEPVDSTTCGQQLVIAELSLKMVSKNGKQKRRFRTLNDRFTELQRDNNIAGHNLRTCPHCGRSDNSNSVESRPSQQPICSPPLTQVFYEPQIRGFESPMQYQNQAQSLLFNERSLPFSPISNHRDGFAPQNAGQRNGAWERNNSNKCFWDEAQFNKPRSLVNARNDQRKQGLKSNRPDDQWRDKPWKTKKAGKQWKTKKAVQAQLKQNSLCYTQKPATPTLNKNVVLKKIATQCPEALKTKVFRKSLGDLKDAQERLKDGILKFNSGKQDHLYQQCAETSTLLVQPNRTQTNRTKASRWEKVVKKGISTIKKEPEDLEKKPPSSTPPFICKIKSTTTCISNDSAQLSKKVKVKVNPLPAKEPIKIYTNHAIY